MIVVVAIIAIPIALIMPLMGATVPPPVILIPAAVAFGVQITTPLRGLTAALAMPANRVLQAGFGFLDTMLAFPVIVIRVHARYRAQHQNPCHGNGCSGRFPNLQVP